MDLMTLAARLTLDDSSFKSGVQSAESAGERLAGKMSAMTVAVGNIMADLARKGFDAIKSMTLGAIDAYADYEQLVGGIETLFKGSSDKMMKYAKESYRTTGLSANQYMETVTSFSASLLQGLGGDTEQAADIADMAIKDMADNANKLGTDISSIQTAYQGFAKQNYTMLDNLKLGYGGTKEEMIRLINDSGILNKEIKSLDGITFDQMIEAIHKIQEEMGITGTTAKEASETISGSKASLVAAWNDLMAAVGGADITTLDDAVAKFQESFSTYMTNFLPALVKTLANSGTLVEGIAGALTSLPNDLLSQILTAALEGGSGTIDGISEVVNWLIDSIATFLSDSAVSPKSVIKFGNSLGQFVGTTAKNFLTKLPQLTADLFAVGLELAGSIIQGIWEGLFGSSTDNKLKQIEDELTETLVDAETQSAKAEAILTTMQGLIDKFGAAATETAEWKKAEDDLETVLGGSKETFEEYGSNVQGAINHLREMTKELRKLAIEQAMQDKLTAQYKLLGEAETDKITAEVAKEEAQNLMDLFEAQKLETAKAYAKQWLELNPDASASARREAELLAQGKAWNGKTGEITDIGQIPFDEFVQTLNTFSAAIEGATEDRVWDQDLTDNILSPEVLAGLSEEYSKQEAVVKSADESIKAADESIGKISGEIDITMQAMSRMSSKIDALGASADLASSKLASITIPKVATSFGGALSDALGNFMPRAVGIDYVPYDGFKTELHRGEAVITKEENERRGSYDAEYLETALQAAIERSMSRMHINMDGEKVADFTTQRVGKNISGTDHARKRAIGG